MSHPLDRPVWSALTDRHHAHAKGTDLARRFDPAVSPFASAVDERPESLQDLAKLLSADNPDDRVFLMQMPEIVVPEGTEAELERQGVQLVKTGEANVAAANVTIRALGPADIDEMVALAHLTKPGPFTSRTPELGTFWGIHTDGKLVAMAGERLSGFGFTEVSGVCTHPDHRGNGYAAILSDHVGKTIEGRGETPFLHAWADNATAIRLYERLGYTIRGDVNVAVLKRAA